MPLLDELLVGLGFEYDPTEAKKFKDDIAKTVNIIGSLTKVAISGAAAITGLTIASTRASDEQGKLADEIGDSVENIDALGFALTRSGGNADGMANSLRQLAVRSSEAARGTGTGVEAFGILGISATDLTGNLKPVSELMLEISGELQGLDKAKQIELADKLGIRDSIRLLQQGPGAISDLTNEARLLGVTTGEDAAIAADFQDSLTDLWRITKQISRTISRVFAPLLDGMVESFTEWWKINRTIIEQNIPIWIERLTKVFKLFSIAVGAFLAFRLATHLVSLINLFRGLSLAALAANAAALLLPALIFLGVAALALLIEDAVTFFRGGDSFIGDMIDKFPQWSNEIRIAASLLSGVWDFTSLILDGWIKIFGLVSGDTSFQDILDVIKTIPAFLKDIIGNAIPNTIKDAIPGFITNLFGTNEISQAGTIGGISGTTNTSSVSVDKVEINVNGSTSPREVAIAVREEQQQAFQDLQTTVDQ